LTYYLARQACGDVSGNISLALAQHGNNTEALRMALRAFNASDGCLAALEEGGKLPDGGYGVVQLVFLMAVYGFVLMTAASLIGDGAAQGETDRGFRGLT
jgi:hypothetical protein